MIGPHHWATLSWPALLGSVRAQVTLWYVAALTLILVLFSGAIYVTEQQALLSQLDGRVHLRLQQLAGAYTAQRGHLMMPPDDETLRGDEVVLLLTSGGRVLQIQAAGPLTSKAPWSAVIQTLRAAAQSTSPAMVEQVLLISQSQGMTKSGLVPDTVIRSGLFRIATMPVMGLGQSTMLLVVGLRSDVPRQTSDLARTLATVAPLILLLCSGGGYWLADRAMRPVRQIARTARQIGETDLSRRLNLRRRDEVGELGATFDSMLDRLQAAFERQRQFTADASHELRTPLATIDLEATRALDRPRTAEEYQQAIAVMQQESTRMAHLVTSLLTLARLDSGQTALQRAAVDLAEIVLDSIERLAPLARRSGMTIAVAPLEELIIHGDNLYLAQMVHNLLENALIHTAGPGTQVSIDGGCRAEAGLAGVWLKIADDGPGVAAAHLPHLFERFYRVDRARTHGSTAPAGSGLGLAIVHWIVRAHGGTIHCISQERQGTTFEIWLPACAPPGRSQGQGENDYQPRR